MLWYWVVMVLVIVALVKWIIARPGEGPRQKSALDVLKERYARGEITREKYEQKKQDLEA